MSDPGRGGRAAKVRAIRKGLGLSQQQLADAMHLTRVTVTRWESGTAEVTDDRLHHLVLYAGWIRWMKSPDWPLPVIGAG